MLIFIICPLFHFTGFGYAFNALPNADTSERKTAGHHPHHQPCPHPPQSSSNELSNAFSVIFKAATDFSFFEILQVWFPFLRMFVSWVALLLWRRGVCNRPPAC
jgi:hypothetical protein